MGYAPQYFVPGYSPFSQAALQQFQQNMPVQPQNMPLQQNMQMQQPQQSMIIHVQSEAQAREWAVAPNSSVTFIDDSSPYCYTKSMGMSMLEPPVFKRFRLEEEEDPQQVPQQDQAQTTPQFDTSGFMTKEEFEPYKSIIEEMQKIAKELNGNE